MTDTPTPTINVIKEDLPSSQVYDNAFTVKQQRWGTFVSHGLDGEALITSPTEQSCVDATRWYLKGRQEGFAEVVTKHEGTVGGKL